MLCCCCARAAGGGVCTLYTVHVLGLHASKCCHVLVHCPSTRLLWGLAGLVPIQLPRCGS